MSEKNSIADELIKLTALANAGALTKDEFERAKAKIIAVDTPVDTVAGNKKVTEVSEEVEVQTSQKSQEPKGVGKTEQKAIVVICAVILSIVIFGALNSFMSSPVVDAPAASNGNPRNTAGSVEAEKISASSLFQQYHSNEVAADEKFKGRQLHVSGIVDSINKDVLDKPYVMLGWGDEYTFSGVQVIFSKNYEGELAKLHKGQSIDVTGICRGMVVGNVLVEVE